MRHALTLTTTLALVAGIALAQEGEAPPTPQAMAHEARERLMHVQAYHLSIIGPMAQGEAEYDAALAGEAAANLASLAQLASAGYLWPEGSSSAELEDSRALPAIWENTEDFQAKAAALEEATATLASAAGTDLASLQGALGAVGQACGACHEAYRAPEE